MDRLDAMALFVAAVDDGSLAAAGRRHGRSAASVTRAVALLEEQAGEPLLLRSTRRLSLTTAGERHLAIWREVLLSLAQLEPGGGENAIRGTIRVTAPELFGRLHLLPLIERFLDANPGVSVRLMLANRLVDLIGDGMDMAVRLAALPDSSLSAIRVGEVRTLLCASPDYLRRAGSPATPEELSQHQCVGLDLTSEAELWPFGLPERSERLRSVRVRPRLRVDSTAAMIDAAVRGQGIIAARSYQVARHLVAGRLVRLLPRFEARPAPVHVIFAASVGTDPARRAFIDHVTEGLRTTLLALAQAVPLTAGD
jgi:DNA-binding transcriptional LysR family regulator